jgi:hypothetical protein
MPSFGQKVRNVFSWQHDTYEFEDNVEGDGAAIASSEDGNSRNFKRKVDLILI